MASKLVQLSDGVDNIYPQGVPYSTSEVRVGTWIDGKPLYRKVVVATNPTSQAISVSLTNPDFVRIVDIIHNGGGYIQSYGWYNSATDEVQAYYNNNVVMFMHIDASGTYWIILEYTKTTD